MKSVHGNLSMASCIVVLMYVAEISFAQDKNPTVYLYGGIPDSSRRIGQFVPLNFHRANFKYARFDSVADFSVAHFDSAAEFSHVYFGSVAVFGNARFDSIAHLGVAYFDSVANFVQAHFGSEVHFERARFGSAAFFDRARFDREANFWNARFDYREANFNFAHFGGRANFQLAHFDSLANFEAAKFDIEADFIYARFDSLIVERAKIRGKFMVGSGNGQKFDFTKTVFLSGARLELWDLVELNIQPEKLKYISLGDELDYFLKRDIIENLKSKSFANDKSAQFELDYIFAKSTMYQEPTGEYKENKWYEIWKWPKWFVNTIYYWTIGLGYRPFRLIWWVFATIIIYTAVFAKKIPGRINAYISNPDANSTGEEKKEVHLSLWETLLNCAYFSVMVFFTFRLKRDILTFFDAKEKRLIVGEWVTGSLVYVAFLTLSKSGSILHNLKELFVG